MLTVTASIHFQWSSQSLVFPIRIGLKKGEQSEEGGVTIQSQRVLGCLPHLRLAKLSSFFMGAVLFRPFWSYAWLPLEVLSLLSFRQKKHLL